MSTRSRQLTALLVTGALLTGFGVSQVAQQLSFRDIPAGHWATSAVQYITQAGLISGFADNSFRGKQNLTRYEAATIFSRLLRSNALKNVDEEGRALIAKGIGEVKVEMDRVRNDFTKLEQSDAGQTARLSALEGQIRNLSRAPTDTGSNAQTVNAINILEARLKTLEDRAVLSAQQEARLATLETRVNALGVVERRVGGLEAQVDTLGKRFGDTTSEYGARLRTLESDAQAGTAQTRGLAERLQNIESDAKTSATQANGLAGRVQNLESDTQTNAAQTKGLAGRLTALEGRVTSLDERFERAATPPAPPPAAATPSRVTITAPPATRPANFYIGASLAYPLSPMPMFDLTRSSYSGMIGAQRLMDLGFTNLGARVSVDYMPVGGVFTINPALTFSGDGLFFSPYLGGGGGVMLGSSTDFFVNGLAGFDVNLLNWATLFAELDPRYSFSANGFLLNTRVGFKIRF